LADWLIETGIGEERALLVERGEVLAAKLRWPGELEAGQVADGVLVARNSGSPRGRARFASGEEALVDRLPRDAAQGRTMRFEITRAAMGEAKRRKLAHARPSLDECRPAPTLIELTGGREVRRFPNGCWEEVWAEASEGIVSFRQGALQFSPTPAMVLVDVDGHLLPRDLALEAVDPLASAIARFGLSGSIGVDFPTLREKSERKALDGALGVALADWDHERTAINGFGFVQLVSRLEGPSLLHRLHFSRSGAAARMLLRRAELVDEPGALLLTGHPQVLAAILPEWQAELARRTGREVRLAPDPGLAPHAAFAQAVPL
jgi:ribonuclease G